MRWEAWVLTAMFTLSGLSTISFVDRPRKAITQRDAVIITILNVVFVWLVARLGFA